VIRRNSSAGGRTPALWLVFGICITVAVLGWLGHRATREWRRSSGLLMQLQAEQTADLLVRALIRDMRGVEDSILRGLYWDEIGFDQSHELSDLAAVAFARYPYPEAFFSLGRTSVPDDVLFFTRADRQPTWLPNPETPSRFPVNVAGSSEAGRHLIDRIMPAARHGRRFVAFETRLGGQVYQVVARLMYRDVRRDELERVFGFVVNRLWVRTSYFPELTGEVARLAGASHLSLAILDDRGDTIAGEVASSPDVPTITRPLRPFFFNPDLVGPNAFDDLPAESWTVRVSAARAPTLLTFAFLSADQTFVVGTAAATALGIGLILTTRALRASAALTKLRCDFVASVTHELKTPLSTIRVIGETLAGGRISTPAEVRDYAQLIDQEAKRLSRLLDNLLAYSRVTDVSEVYSFEALAPADLLEDSLRGFEPQLAQDGCEAYIDIPSDLPFVRADRVAMSLVLDNLIDNALRYSAERRWLKLTAAVRERMVEIVVCDRGVGIPPEELEQVTHRFVRGRQARSHGSGLGLAIAGQVVRDHGGRLTIESVLGEGTAVTLTLPVMEL
jgi:signal transduction histidine kinase